MMPLTFINRRANLLSLHIIDHIRLSLTIGLNGCHVLFLHLLTVLCRSLVSAIFNISYYHVMAIEYDNMIQYGYDMSSII